MEDWGRPKASQQCKQPEWIINVLFQPQQP